MSLLFESIFGLAVSEAYQFIKDKFGESESETFERELKNCIKSICEKYKKDIKRAEIADPDVIWEDVSYCLKNNIPLESSIIGKTDERVNDSDRTRFFDILISQLNRFSEFYLRNSQSTIEKMIKVHDNSNGKEHDKMLAQLKEINELLKNLSAPKILSQEESIFENTIILRQCFNILEDYLCFSDVKPVISYADSNAMQISVVSNGFKMKIDKRKCPTDNREQRFVMALIEYIPSEDFSVFWEHNYSLEFDIVAISGLKAVQLEIKNSHRDKIVDKMVSAHKSKTHISFSLRRLTRSALAWKEINQICFTVFINSDYIESQKGSITIENLVLLPNI